MGQDYLANVLIKIQPHPHSKIDEILSHKWKPPPEQGKQDNETDNREE